MDGPGKRGPAKGYKPKEGVNKGNAGKGRPKNTPNKATTNAREAIAAFVDRNSGRLESLLEEIEERQGPKAAWDCIMDLVEYHVPKLARTELTGKDGGPQEVNQSVTITFSGTAPK